MGQDSKAVVLEKGDKGEAKVITVTIPSNTPKWAVFLLIWYRAFNRTSGEITNAIGETSIGVSKDNAMSVISRQPNVDYFRGIPIGVDFSTDVIDVTVHDEMYGEGAFESAVKAVQMHLNKTPD